LNRRESSARSGWLSSFIGNDSPQADRRRLVIGFALAIALHEIVALVFPWHPEPAVQPPEPQVTIAKVVRIEHRPLPTPKPTPRPTPKPTPRPIVHSKIVAPTHVKPRVVNPGRPSQHNKVRHIASARPRVHTRFHRKPAPIHVEMGGHGAGTSTKAKAETGGIGPGGTGTGESGNGNGAGGAPAAQEPCGYVEFEPNETIVEDQATGRVWEHITMTVHFPDGSQQSVDLGYPWYYPSRAEDPFLPQNSKLPATFQFPPPDQRDNQSPLVQYVIAHTTTDGYTKLHECPGQTATSGPAHGRMPL
jgi:hypothetical protein